MWKRTLIHERGWCLCFLFFVFFLSFLPRARDTRQEKRSAFRGSSAIYQIDQNCWSVSVIRCNDGNNNNLQKEFCSSAALLDIHIHVKESQTRYFSCWRIWSCVQSHSLLVCQLKVPRINTRLDWKTSFCVNRRKNKFTRTSWMSCKWHLWKKSLAFIRQNRCTVLEFGGRKTAFKNEPERKKTTGVGCVRPIIQARKKRNRHFRWN